MENILLPAALAVVVFIGFLVLFMQWISSDEDVRKKAVLEQISQESELQGAGNIDNISLLKEQVMGLPTTGAGGTLAKIPFVYSTFEMMGKAGFAKKRVLFLFVIYMIFIVLMLAFRGMGLGLWSAFLALALAILGGRKYLQNRITGRVLKFLDMFPDATDMMIRSVRAGHPLSAALRMIAENMDDPIRAEFKKLVDEVAYGRSLTEALQRLGKRVDSQDVNFFVVVLTVQQETGGSLAEVLTNLSGMLRKRKQLRLKIRALTSEGRASSYILGALPCFEFAALSYFNPNYMQPLFHTTTGNVLLGIAIILVVGCVILVRKMADIDI